MGKAVRYCAKLQIRPQLPNFRKQHHVQHTTQIADATRAARALFETDDINDAVTQLQGSCEVAAITRGDKGALVVTADSRQEVAAQKISALVDTTGAGDLFAAGFLYGYTRGWPHEKSAALGNKTAAQIITQFGARSMQPLATLIAA